MANTYAAPNFNIDTSTNVAGLTALKGGAPASTDYIYVYNGATLTVESALAIFLISLGETSAGAAADGQRRGNLTVDAGVTVTFTGSATATLSGIKSNPASAPGTAGESKSNTLTINGTAASPCVFTNSAGAYNASYRYMINWVYGGFGAMGVWQFNYPSPANAAGAFYLPPSGTYSNSATHNLGWVTHTSGAATVNYYLLCPGVVATRSIHLVIESLTMDFQAQGGGRAILPYYALVVGAARDAADFIIKRYWVLPSTSATNLLYDPIFSLAASADIYARPIVFSFSENRATEVVPTGLALADLQDGTVRVTCTNTGSVGADDVLVLRDGATDIVLGKRSFYTAAWNRKPANCFILAGVPLAALAGVTAFWTSDLYVESNDSAAAGAVTPTFQPPINEVNFGRGYGQEATEFVGTRPGGGRHLEVTNNPLRFQ